MSWLLPLTVALPFTGAALGVALDHWLPEWVKQFPALVFSVATTVCAVLALAHSGSAPVHWFGGWQPKHGIAIGIAFVGEPLGAGMAALAGVLATATAIGAPPAKTSVLISACEVNVLEFVPQPSVMPALIACDPVT